MKIYQPMLFVGLGGTGGRIGAELERSLRRELCGPDGTRLVDGGRRAPFQLPDCLQFVYADFSEGDLKWHPQFSTKGSEAAAYARTTHMVNDLLPGGFESSSDVTRMLRVALPEETRDWLPPDVRQPRVAPLHNGAGQLPTVGRAALFATLRGGLEPVLRPLRAAISAIGTSAGDLQRLGGGRIRGCDVFVAFSVAGGTGAGIYHDFLHLVGHEFRNAGVPGVKIYPLVVMPSAFPPEAGGGREAELNGARALVDLSRLVDDQNMPVADSDVGDVEHRSRISVRYPGDTVVRLRASTVQTAFLFSKPTVIRREDLRRSITALVMSLIGTELPDRAGGSQDDYQSFAESFINKGVERSSHASSGIGYRSMSTTLAASLTVPVDDLAEIVAARLLAQAVRSMDERARKPVKDGTQRVREMFEQARVDALWSRAAPDVPDPEVPPRGSRAVTLALHNRRGDMEDALNRLERDLARDTPRLVEEFQPGGAVREMLSVHGPFDVRTVVQGLREHPEPVAEAGFKGMLDNRRNEPRRPPHVQQAAPQVPRIKGGAAGLVPARWSDPDVRKARTEQDDWYRWRANALWHHAWRENESRWRPVLNHAVQELEELVTALRRHADEEGKAFTARRRELYRDDRKGVSYLLPPQNSLRVFYDDVLRRLGRSLHLPEENTDAAQIVGRLVGASDWLRALEAVRHSHGAAVKEVKQVLERRVKALFGEESKQLNERPLLPSMAQLLRAAAGRRDGRGRRGRPVAGAVPRPGRRTPPGRFHARRQRPPQGAHHLPAERGGEPHLRLPEEVPLPARARRRRPAPRRLRVHHRRAVPQRDEPHRHLRGPRTAQTVVGGAGGRPLRRLPALAAAARLPGRLARQHRGGPAAHPPPRAVRHVERARRPRRRRRLPGGRAHPPPAGRVRDDGAPRGTVRRAALQLGGAPAGLRAHRAAGGGVDHRGLLRPAHAHAAGRPVHRPGGAVPALPGPRGGDRAARAGPRRGTHRPLGAGGMAGAGAALLDRDPARSPRPALRDEGQELLRVPARPVRAAPPRPGGAGRRARAARRLPPRRTAPTAGRPAPARCGAPPRPPPRTPAREHTRPGPRRPAARHRPRARVPLGRRVNLRNTPGTSPTHRRPDHAVPLDLRGPSGPDTVRTALDTPQPDDERRFLVLDDAARLVAHQFLYEQLYSYGPARVLCLAVGTPGEIPLPGRNRGPRGASCAVR
ncbi:tubulin-like doman-containing protein [Streptomyces somaliensis]|uniref:tubulin-like doman-containing protein n=1 Tax=Streptomyces somaliensis TaxID=78355 RepID=UPI0034E936B8